MKFAIITHVPHCYEDSRYFAYAPYVREMNIWGEYCDELIIVAPLQKIETSAIDEQYENETIDFRAIPNFNVNTILETIKTIGKAPMVFYQIFKAMLQADHIHLRCPGNVGLLGCLIQMLFPSKPKTAKYAGNWDPLAVQPWSYRLQKWILNNAFLTRNIQVLVYGEWPHQSKNIKPFFTATYKEADKIIWKQKKEDNKINFIFVGTLVKGKNPLYAIQIVEALLQKGKEVSLCLYGEGVLKESLQSYILKNKLEKSVFLKGNQSKEILMKAYQESHFVILPSISEGWPKAIAEGMFWGCVPLATAVSCVPYMLDHGKRGLLLHKNKEQDVDAIKKLIEDTNDFNQKSRAAQAWSQQYTTDYFESEIKQLL